MLESNSLEDIADARNIESIGLSFVVPVFNESETVSLFVERVKTVFDKFQAINLEIIFINDGSSDDTLIRLLDLQKQFDEIRIVDLSRNFGKEAALTAGLNIASGHVVVPIDVDLQDPPELVLQMIEKWREGYDVVVGKRVNRDSDTWAKRKSATWFYRIHNKISEPKIPENVGDFRLMDRSVVDALKALPESRRFMKGLFAWVGFKTVAVEYARPERIAGTTKFNGWRLWNFALEGALLHKSEGRRDYPSPRRSYAMAPTGTVLGRPSCVKRLSRATRTCNSTTCRSNVRAITRWPRRLKQCILVSTSLLR